MNIILVRNALFAIIFIIPFIFSARAQTVIEIPFTQSEQFKAEPRIVYRSLGENPDITLGSEGVLFAIELANDSGWGSPSIVKRGLNEEWDATPWNGQTTAKYKILNISVHGGAPCVVQLSAREIVLTAHTGGRNGKGKIVKL